LLNNIDIKKYAVKFGTARSNLLLVVAFTMANVMLTAFGSDFYLLFSATVPMLALILLEDAMAVGLIVAMLGVFVYFLCWLLSKRKRVFILVALILFSVDTLLFLATTGIVFLLGFGDFMIIVEIAFHGWILYYLITGTAAWAKLRGVTEEQLDDAKTAVDNEVASAAMNELTNNDDKGAGE